MIDDRVVGYKRQATERGNTDPGRCIARLRFKGILQKWPEGRAPIGLQCAGRSISDPRTSPLPGNRSARRRGYSFLPNETHLRKPLSVACFSRLGALVGTRPVKLIPEHGHQSDIDIRSIDVGTFSQGALFFEAILEIRLNRPLVASEDVQVDPLKVQILEPVTHQQTNRFAAKAPITTR